MSQTHVLHSNDTFVLFRNPNGSIEILERVGHKTVVEGRAAQCLLDDFWVIFNQGHKLSAEFFDQAFDDLMREYTRRESIGGWSGLTLTGKNTPLHI